MSLSQEAIQNENPWRELRPRAPYVLAADGPAIDAYNENRKTLRENRIRLDIPPTPFVGSVVNPRVLVLTLSPPWHEDEVCDYTDNPAYARECWQNLTFGNQDFPFYAINPAFENTQAYQWWYPKLQELIEACDGRTDGQGRQCVARGLLSIAFFPYHVNNYRADITALRCQRFARELVRRFRDEGVPIVITSQAAVWVQELPKLKEQFYAASNRQSRSLSRANLPKGVFDLLVDALVGSAPAHEQGEEPAALAAA